MAQKPRDEVERGALLKLMEVIRDDSQGSTLKILEHNNIKDPTIILMLPDDEIEALKTSKNKVIDMPAAKKLMMFKKHHNCRQSLQLPCEPEEWEDHLNVDDCDNHRTSMHLFDWETGLPLTFGSPA